MDRLLFNFHDVVLLMTLYQCSLFALLLLVINRGKTLSNVLLAGFLLTQAAIPLDTLISFGAAFRHWAIHASPNLFYTFGLAYWLEGPLLLWYTRSLIYKDFRFKRIDSLYLLPFLAYFIYEIAVFFQFSHYEKMAILESNELLKESVTTHIIGFSREILRVFFGVMCLVEIHRCRQALQDNYSNIENIDFRWLKILTIGFLGIRLWAVLVSAAIILSAHMDIPVNFRIMGLASNYTVFILISAMIFLSLSYSSMFEGIDATKIEKTQEKQGFSEEQITLVTQAMEREKYYLASILTLEQLANKMGITQRTLSNIINRHFGCNFFEFVNRYRIEESKRLLEDPSNQDMTVMDIMMSSGFNSKATFNTFFKKLEGVTPSQYRKGVGGCTKQQKGDIFHPND